MAKKAHREKATGRQPGRLVELVEEFNSDAKRLAGPPDEKALTAAAGYWIGYPVFREVIEFNSDDPTERYSGVAALDLAHVEATKVLMRKAASMGLDPAPLWEGQRVCREVFLTWKPWSDRRGVAVSDMWPDCLGKHRYDLPQGQQDAIRDAEAVFVGVALELGIRLPMLSRGETVVLRALAANHPCPMTLEDMEGRIELSAKTIGPCVNGLIGKGLAVRPNGPRSGATATADGLEIIRKFPSS